VNCELALSVFDVVLNVMMVCFYAMRCNIQNDRFFRWKIRG
jgi:hypothetical protein